MTQYRALASLVVCMAVASFGGTVAAQAPATPPPDQAQIEKGRQVVAQVCASCHTTIGRMVQAHKQTAEQWKDTVFFMISRGAQIMPDEIEPVTAYLTATAGRGATAAGAAARPQARPQAAELDGAGQCHELGMATTKPDGQDWPAVVTRMTTYGARLTPAEREKLIEYLNGLKK
jgi:mono/diheme cytochrome c family protein